MSYEAFRQIVERRRSVRRFSGAAVSEAALRQVLEAARLAPSAGNLQAWRVVVARDGGARKALARAALCQEFVAQAPVALVFIACSDTSGRKYGRRGRDLYAAQDATIAATFAMLAVEALGLGTVWVGAFDTEDVARVVGCGAGETPVAILPVGTPAEAPAAAERRSLEAVVREL